MSQSSKRLKTLHSFFKSKDNSPKNDQHPSEEVDAEMPTEPTQGGQHHPMNFVGQPPPLVIQRVEPLSFEYTSLERDPGIRRGGSNGGSPGLQPPIIFFG